jgi:uncharacterized protein (DUF2147 family)
MLGISLLALLAAAPPSQSNDGDAILGLWLTEAGKARVEVRREGNEYRGRIVWLQEPTYSSDDPKGMSRQPKVDRLNHDEKLRNRPVLGLEILTGFRYAGKQEWKRGRLYDPERGKSYKGRLWLTKEGTLKLRGRYLIFHETSEWTRIEDETAPPHD